MKQASDMVKNFFEAYERGSNSADPEPLVALYSDSFMFGGPQGAQAVKKEDFRQALPKRAGFFKMVGLAASKLVSLEETQLDDRYIMVKASWRLQFEKDGAQPVVDEIAATYILYQQGSELRIVFQLDHQDLMERVQALGLLPGKV
jgi:hypothetical protein